MKSKLILVSTCVTHFCQCSCANTEGQIQLQYDLFALYARIVCMVKDTWSVKAKFDGRPSRRSLASGELQLIIFWKVHLSSSEMSYL